MKQEDEIIKRIYGLRQQYIRDLGINPNVIYVGFYEFFTLLNIEKVTPNYPESGMTIFGIEVDVIDKDRHLSLGYVIE